MSLELWTIRGGTPVAWTLPVWVKQGYWEKTELTPAMPIPLQAMHVAFVDRMTEAGGKLDGNAWRIARKHLELIGQVMPGGTEPENCFSWERKRDQVKFITRMERNEFVDALYQKGVGNSRAECVFWWNQFCNHILDWLINEDRPVDMFFIRLLPCSIRTNWREGIFHRLSRHMRAGRAKTLIASKDPRIAEILAKPGMLAYKRCGRVERHVELQHTDLWWKVIKRVDEERIRLVGVCQYAAEVLASQKRFIEPAMDIFRSWLRHGVAPPVQIRDGGSPGSRCFVTYTRTGKLGRSPTVATERDAKAVLRAAGRSWDGAHRKKKLRMLHLRRVRSRKTYMRRRRRDIRIADYEKARAAGLLVLPPIKKPAESELLAGGGNGGPPGVAAGT